MLTKIRLRILVLLSVAPLISCLDINDTCTIKESELSGLCLLDTDCEFVFHEYKYLNGPKPQICGYKGLSSVVCCPENLTVKSNKFTETKNRTECLVEETGENGVYKILEHCKTLSQFEKSQISVTNICDDQICRDLVCCPIRTTHRWKNICLLYDDPKYVITSRLMLQESCQVQGTGLPGIYAEIEYCPSAQKIIEDGGTVTKPCQFDYCSNWTCCAIETSACSLAQPYLSDYTQTIGGSCVDKASGLNGICKHSDFCPYLFQESRYLNMTMCGYECCKDIVCCPSPELHKLGVGDQQCASNTKSVFENTKTMRPLVPDLSDSCGFGGQGIAGGFPVGPKEFPHMVALGFQANLFISWDCGGTLISDEYVLTAAHCIYSNELGFVKFARLGALDLTINPLVEDCPEDYQIVEIIQHPGYSSKSSYNDIALLRLDKKVEFNPFIRPACLPPSAKTPEYFVITGWGATGSLAPKSEILIKASVQLFNQTECFEHYRSNINQKLEFGIVEATQICAGSRSGEEDACPGDSGGPLFLNHPDYYKMFIIYGLTSFGKPCGFAGSPGVYTKVYPFKEWIEKIVWKS